MKKSGLTKLGLIVLVIIIGLVSCYKEKQPPQPFDILTRHKWKISYYINQSIDSGVNCRVPSEVEFNKDSTGYFVYTAHCRPDDSLVMPFSFYFSYDNRNIFYVLPGGSDPIVCGLSQFDDSTLILLNPDNVIDRYVDGHFKAFADKK